MLNNAIEAICNSAPDTFGRYRMEGKSEEEKNNIRAKGYIHLFLLIKFGLQDFKTRHDYITDGPGDGGVDAYYIDTNRRVIYLIQSKYRIDEGNYENKEISSAEIASMELKSILDGKLNGEDGRPYNGKIRGMQKKISGLPNLGLYDYKIILLANLYKSESLKVVKTIFSGLSYDVFDYTRAYDELVFPYCTSTYFQEHPVWGNGTRYGKYALLSVAGRLVSAHLEKRTGLADILELAERSLEIILNEWGEFEKYVRTLQTNETYFKNEVNYFNYYKSQNVQNDINVFWSNYEMEESAELCLVKKTGH